MRMIIILISVILLPVAAFAQDTTLTVTSGGNVGIGTTTPKGKLHIYDGNLRISGGGNWLNSNFENASILFDYSGTGWGTGNRVFRVVESGGEESSFITLGGIAFFKDRVGIGTSTPGRTLVVNGDNTTVLKVNANGTNVAADLILSINDDEGWIIAHFEDSGRLDFIRQNGPSETSTPLTLAENGRVGIGTTNPLAKLHVSGVGMTIDSFSGLRGLAGSWMARFSHRDGIRLATDGDPVTDVSIYASGSIVADGSGVFVAGTVNWSDERTKKVIGRSSSKVDLDILNQIEIIDYVKIKEGNREKKVIAQQLRAVFPQAVSFMRGVVPTIFEMTHDCSYEKATELLTVTVKKEHEFAIGDEVDIYTDQKNLTQVKVKAVPSPHTFIVTADHQPNRVFVYGKWVDDVHMVDYDAVSMLNVSATQELAKRVEALEIENAQLKTQNLAFAKQGAAINVLQDKIAQLEVILQKMTAMTRINSHTTASATMPANAKHQMSMLKNETGE